MRTTVPLETDGVLAREGVVMDYPESNIHLGLSKTVWTFRSRARSGLGRRVASCLSPHRFRWLIVLDNPGSIRRPTGRNECLSTYGCEGYGSMGDKGW